MTAQEVYIAFLNELKQENTTSVTPAEFNYHIWRSEIEYVKNRYFAFDQHQKSIDDLSFLTIETIGVAGMPLPLLNQGLNQSKKEYFDLPEDLLILVNVEIMAEAQNDSCYKDGEISDKIAAKFLSGDRDKVIYNSYYSKPRLEYPNVYYKIRNNKIIPVIGDSIAKECIITYLKYPTKIEVDETSGLSITNSEFKDMQTLEIVRHAVLSYLETIESQRTPSMAQIENKNFNQFPPPNYYVKQQ